MVMGMIRSRTMMMTIMMMVKMVKITIMLKYFSIQTFSKTSRLGAVHK